MGRMRVKKPDPEISRNLVELPQQRAKRGGILGQGLRSGLELFRRRNGSAPVRPQIQAVIGSVLGNQIEFLDAIRNQLPRFLHDVALLPASMGAAHSRNDAKAAGMVASFGDLYVSEVPGR